MRNRFRLRTSTIAVVYDEGGKKVTEMIPAGAVIKALGVVPLDRVAVDPTEQIEVSWKGRSMSMFLVDLLDRGVRVLEV
jgi:hypothetical protein